MKLSEFAGQHGGINVVARRHFQYEKPVEVPATECGGNLGVLGAMVYTRALDPAKLGLSVEGSQNAFKQGGLLVENGFVPEAIITGIDQRNRDGGRFSAEGIKQQNDAGVSVYTSPAVTYPHYLDPFYTAEQMEKYGDGAVHRSFNGGLCLWTEERTAFALRIRSAMTAKYPFAERILFDLNFEQMVYLYYELVKKMSLDDIPSENGWCPKYGDCVVIAGDGTAALFSAELDLVETQS